MKLINIMRRRSIIHLYIIYYNIHYSSIAHNFKFKVRKAYDD